jgi:hypothetical protein
MSKSDNSQIKRQPMPNAISPNCQQSRPGSLRCFRKATGNTDNPKMRQSMPGAYGHFLVSRTSRPSATGRRGSLNLATCLQFLDTL